VQLRYGSGETAAAAACRRNVAITWSKILIRRFRGGCHSPGHSAARAHGNAYLSVVEGSSVARRDR
jgi:hypothetical protein